MNDSRLYYIDVIRGVMILLVIYSHLIYFCIYTNTECANPSYFTEIMQRVRMPLFFTITGFLSYGIDNLEIFGRRVRNRLYKQLWPTFLIFVVYEIFCGKGFILAIGDDAKDGYWFTYSLVQVWFVYALLSIMMSQFHISKKTQFIIIATIAAISFPAHLLLENYHNDLFTSLPSRILSFSRTLSLIPFFFLGVMLRSIYNQIERMYDMLKMGGGISLTISLLLIFVMLSQMWLTYQIRLSEIVGVLALLSLFYISRSYWGGNSYIATHLRTLGKMTLPIYLFHYFVLYIIRHLHLLDSFTSYIGKIYLELPYLMILSILIAQICIWIDKVLTLKKPLHRLVFGA